MFKVARRQSNDPRGGQRQSDVTTLHQMVGGGFLLDISSSLRPCDNTIGSSLVIRSFSG